ncbi:MAG: tetratricopeptide repeat protein [Myxococcales bacterium]
MLAALVAAALLAATPAQQDEARQLSRRSIVEYDAGDFEKALADITRAYELDPRPGLLYNLGQCHRALEHWKKAKFFFQGYLHQLPDAPNRKTVRRLIAEGDAKIAEQERKEEAVREALTAPAPGETTVPLVIPAPAPEQPVPAAAVFGPAPVPEEGHGARIAGWTLVAVGLAAGLGGGAWSVVNQQGKPQLASNPPSAQGTFYQATKDQVDGYNRQVYLSDAVWGAGAALLVAGAILLLVSH